MSADRIHLSDDADDQQVLAKVLGYYHACLKGTPEAVEYLHKRGITHPAVVDHFRLGYSDRSLGLRLPSRDSKGGAAVRVRLQSLGVLRVSGHEHLRGSITFPVYSADGSGQIADIYGRKVQGDKLRKGTDLHTHLSPDRRGVFNVGSFGPASEIIVTPSVFDALTFWNAGYRHVTCTFSPTDPPPHLIPALVEFDIDRVLATNQPLADKLLAAGLEVFLVRLPVGHDVNTYSRRTKDPADALGSLLRHAEWVGRGTAPPTPIMAPVARADAADGVQAELAARLDTEEDDPEPGDGDRAAEVQTDDPPGAPFAEPPVRTASPVPAAPPPDDVTVTDAEVVFRFGSRRYRVRGLDKNPDLDQLRINLLASNGVGLHTDTFDLYVSKARAGFVAQAAVEMNVEERVTKADVGRILLKLEELQDAKYRPSRPKTDVSPDMTADERAAALDLLTDPALLDRIVADFGVVGTRTNKLTLYLAAVSRKLDRPLGVVVQSASAAGKTTLVDAALELVPVEDRMTFSAVTGQGLYYLADGTLRHKVLCVAEEAGASKAGYALKLLLSEGRLTIASTGKSDAGRLVTETYTVDGPVALVTTTTSTDVDEELLNRCLLLAVDEDRDQTRAVHAAQRRRETLAGLVEADDHGRVVRRHRNAQRLLRPVRVVNPWAERLTFPDGKARTRRDHAKYLTLIRTVTLLHQHQRPVRTAEVNGKVVEYIETTLEDVAAANELAAAVLGRGLDDLPPQTRNLLVLIDRLVTAAGGRERVDRPDVRFTRRDLREFCSWGDTQVKVHLKRLVEMELVLVHRARDARRPVYELACTPAGDGRALPGLIDVDALRRAEWSAGGPIRSGVAGDRSGSGRGAVGPRSGGGRGSDTPAASTSEAATPHGHAGQPDVRLPVPELEAGRAEAW